MVYFLGMGRWGLRSSSLASIRYLYNNQASQPMRTFTRIVFHSSLLGNPTESNLSPKRAPNQRQAIKHSFQTRDTISRMF